MKSVFAITVSTLTELRRQRLLIVPAIALVLSIIVLSVAYGLGGISEQSRQEDMRAAAYWIMTFAMIGAAIYALIIGSTLIAREITQGTLLVLASRPVSRVQILLGRALGALILLLIAVAVVAVCYAIMFSLGARSFAPVSEILLAILLGLPAMLLALSFGVACSIQGRATAAIGTSIALTVFATFVGAYALDWRFKQGMFRYVTPAVQERVDPPSGVIGRSASAIERVLPYATLGGQAIATFERRFDGPSVYRDSEKSITVDTHDDANLYRFGGYYSEGEVGPTNTQESSGDPGANDGVPDPTPLKYPKVPDDPSSSAIECVRWNSAQCLFGYDNAWTKQKITYQGRYGGASDYLWSLLTIPIWMAVAGILMVRRRDLA